MARVVNCPSCGGQLKKKAKTKSNLSGCLVGVIGFVIGLLIFGLIPIIGWVLGPLIIIASSFKTFPKSYKYWKCKNRKCRFTMPR